MRTITEQQFNEALNRVAASLDGQIVLACLKEFVNYDGDLVVEKDPQSTYANATLRRAYMYLRRRIHPDHLKQIEFNYIRKAEPNDREPRSTKPSDRAAKPTTKRTSVSNS